ncbi:MAG: DUF2974 domain-containing protein [Sulfurospirillum cavolei]|nr:DUF2974 domain-containing protein [Sulfurospirillum cavolei]
MQLTNQVKQSALLSELAYLKLEDAYWTIEVDGKIPSYSNIKDIETFLTGVNSEGKPYTTGIDDSRDSEMLALLSNYTIVDFKNIPTTISGLNDMQAMLLRDKEGNTVISFRGTEGLSDAAIDALMLTGVYTNQMSAITWVQELQASGQLTGNVTITGHSLGGALAQYVAYDILTCKDFQTSKSLHVRTKIKQKGARHGTQPKVA